MFFVKNQAFSILMKYYLFNGNLLDVNICGFVNVFTQPFYHL